MLLTVVAAVSLVGQAGPATSASCAGDEWADYSFWNDNYWVSDNCNTASEYVRGIQIITNESSDGNCSAGVVDGWWGANTRNGVMCMQDRWGITEDGIVGPDTWEKYRTEVRYQYMQGDFQVYRTDWVLDRFDKYTPTQHWYVDRQCDDDEKVAFWVWGPSYSAC
jgi:hypothetical protein